MSTNEPRLCYVSSNWAYFTTQELKNQWGDDWDDAPYELNAGPPYSWGEYERSKHIDPWTITKVAFSGAFMQPCDGHVNSPHSVQMINRGDVPWLRLGHTKIMAGATLNEFIAAVQGRGGKVYVEYQGEPSPEPIIERQERFMTSVAELLVIMGRKLSEVTISDQSAAIKELEASQRVWPEIVRSLDRKTDELERRIKSLEAATKTLTDNGKAIADAVADLAGGMEESEEMREYGQSHSHLSHQVSNLAWPEREG